MSESNLIEDLLRRDRKVVVAALVVIILGSWAYILAGAGMGMSAFNMSSLEMALGWSDGDTMQMESQSGGMDHGESDGSTQMGSGMSTAMSSMASQHVWLSPSSIPRT